jgi:quercetin dioxygenase-like cupin family protein
MNAMRWIFAAQGIVVMVPIALAALGAHSKSQSESTPVQFPQDYRSWQHVRSIVVGREHRSFASRGGIHHYYANPKAVEGYRTGRFPNGSIVVDEGVFAEDGTGPMKGIVVEGHRRTLDVMVKNDRLYKDTGGWGFEHFEGQESAGKLDASRRTQCFECHSKSKDRDYVFSAIRVAKFGDPVASQADQASQASQAGQAGQAGQTRHSMISPGDLKWSSAAPGVSMAVLSGSPDADGAPFAIRLKLADGTRVPPHWHPTDEHLTVVSGTFHMGVGERFDESAATAMTSGSYGVMPKEVRHFGWVTGETVVQIHGAGPFKTFFVGQPPKGGPTTP